MAEEGDFAASSSSQAMSKEKPVIVRVKRKASQTPLDALWLEISERPPKRTILDMANLSFTGTIGQNKGNSMTKRVLVQHVQTVQCSEATKDLLELCLEKSTDSGSRNKPEERKSSFKKDKRPELLHSNARLKHAELARSARFEQIWRSRMSEDEKVDDFISKMYRLYNVVRVDDDDDEKRHENDKAPKVGPDDENSILCNYMPLIREYLPTAADEIESNMNTNASNGDAYMYDIYTMEAISDSKAQVSSDYPLVHVNDQDLYDDDSESGWETDDSNGENNPRNDYPDEESSEDGDVLLSEEEYEEDISGASEEDDNDDHDWRWGYR